MVRWALFAVLVLQLACARAVPDPVEWWQEYRKDRGNRTQSSEAETQMRDASTAGDTEHPSAPAGPNLMLWAGLALVVLAVLVVLVARRRARAAAAGSRAPAAPAAAPSPAPIEQADGSPELLEAPAVSAALATSIATAASDHQPVHSHKRLRRHPELQGSASADV